MPPDPRPRILFLCTANSCRSQMAEGFARALLPHLDAHSAGIRSSHVNPLAVRAMAEVGLDISHHPSKTIENLRREGIDRFTLIIAVCDGAAEACPVIPGSPILRAPFDDPPTLAAGAPTDDDAMPHYRRVRDEIRAFITTLPSRVPDLAPPPPRAGEVSTRLGEVDGGGSTPRSHRVPPHRPPPLLKESPMPNLPPTPKSCCTPGSDCCTPAHPLHTSRSRDADHDQLRTQVREGYAAIARAGSWTAAQQPTAGAATVASVAPAVDKSDSPRANTPPPGVTLANCCGPAAGPSGGCCGPSTLTPDQVAAAIGYAHADLSANPADANMGLSCGNPTAIAALRPGETVLDLGSGGGFDCFIAGRKVGPTGRVIGVDMTPDMVTKARRNIATYHEKSGLSNVEFRLGEIENIPVADASVDVVISNCVLNLSPDKPRVWQEIARVLKPGGRIAVSDLALLRPLPDAIRTDLEALVGCIAGAVLIDDTRAQMIAAGLRHITLTSKPEYIDAMTQWEDPLYRRIIAALPPGSETSDYITSLDIAARR